jgi:rare lipoprotein A
MKVPISVGFRVTVIAGAALALLAACVPRRPVVGGGAIQTGEASWYGPDFHGKQTSNREVYDMFELTAAHNTLPFGTRVMVTNLSNGRAVVVRINDRGPFLKNRIIDLSYAAARLLDMVGSGVAPVRLDILKGSGLAPAVPRYSVQVGSFVDKKNALALEKSLQGTYPRVYIAEFRTPSQVYYRVRIPAADKAAAEKIGQRLAADGYRVLILEGEEFHP